MQLYCCCKIVSRSSCFSIFSYGIHTHYISVINKYMREKSKTNKYSAIEIVCGRKLADLCAMRCFAVYGRHCRRHFVPFVEASLCAVTAVCIPPWALTAKKKCSRFIIKIHVYIYLKYVCVCVQENRKQNKARLKQKKIVVASRAVFFLSLNIIIYNKFECKAFRGLWWVVARRQYNEMSLHKYRTYC